MSQDVLGSSALADIAGPLKDFAEKLGGSEGPMWFSGFKRFLRKENPWVLKLIQQMKVAIGGLSKEDLLLRIEAQATVSSWARDIYGKPELTVSPTATEVEFGWITVGDLGFTKMPTTLELNARIREVADLCSREDGPHLRVADKDQPCETTYWVPMEPISNSAGSPGVWCVGRSVDGERWLSTNYAGPGLRWGLERVVALRLRK